MRKNFLAKIISIIFNLILILGVISLPFIPKLYDLFKDYQVESFANHNFLYQLAFYSCFIICLIIVLLLNIVFISVYKSTPFTKKVENALKISSVMFLLLSAIIIIKIIFIPTILSFAVAFICLIAFLSFFVLAEVIKQAIEYKNEIDYTV